MLGVCVVVFVIDLLQHLKTNKPACSCELILLSDANNVKNISTYRLNKANNIASMLKIHFITQPYGYLAKNIADKWR